MEDAAGSSAGEGGGTGHAARAIAAAALPIATEELAVATVM